MLILAAIGSAAWLLARGVPGLVSFLAGAGVSATSFWLLHRSTGDVERAARGQQTSGLNAVFGGLRIFILGCLLYGILRSYGVFLPALATGLLLAVIAITIEALFELFYARA